MVYGSRSLASDDPDRKLAGDVVGRSVTTAEWGWMVGIDGVLDDLRVLDSDGRRRAIAQSWARYRKAEEEDTERYTDGSRSRAAERVSGWLRDDERVRAVALSEWLATSATHHPVVVDFRATHPQGAPPADEWPPSSYWPDLRRVATILATALPWTTEDAERFLGTGDTPMVSPLTASTEAIDYAPDGRTWSVATGTIIIVAQAWLSEGTIARAFRRMRQDMLGPDAKPITHRELAIFRFVVPRLSERERPTVGWAALGREWNQHHQDDGWKYKAPNGMQRTYRGVRDRLLRPSYQWWYRRLGILPLAPGDPGAENATTDWPVHHDVIRYQADIEDVASRVTPTERGLTDGDVDGNPDGNR